MTRRVQQAADEHQPKNNQLQVGEYTGVVTEIRSQGFCTEREVLLIAAEVPTHRELRPDDAEQGEGAEQTHKVWMRWPTAADNGAYTYGRDRFLDLSRKAKLALTGRHQNHVRAFVHSDAMDSIDDLIDFNVQVVIKQGQSDGKGGFYPNECTFFPEQARKLSMEDAMRLLNETAPVTQDEEPADD